MDDIPADPALDPLEWTRQFDITVEDRPWRRPYTRVYYDASRAFDSAAEPFTTAAALLDNLFSSIYYEPRNPQLEDVARKRSHGTLEDIPFRRYYFEWKHRPISDAEQDTTILCIERDELRSAVRNHLRIPSVHSEFLDWYCAETICYMEWYAFLHRVLGEGLLRHSALFGLLTRLSQSKRQHQASMDLVSTMRYSYDIMETGVFSWEVLWLDLNRTRELGAVWPGELYKLVEMRRPRAI